MRSKRSFLNGRRRSGLAIAVIAGLVAGAITARLDLPAAITVGVWLVGVAIVVCLIVPQVLRGSAAPIRLDFEVGRTSSFQPVKVWREGELLMSLNYEEGRSSTGSADYAEGGHRH